jgi:predicted permease
VRVPLVFVAAQVNVMNLLLARAAARRRELAIRVAVGAGRARLVQQLLIETTMLAIVGGCAGLLLASWTTAALAAVRLPGNLPVHFDFHADARVLAYAFALACVTAATVGVLAALRASRVDVDAALRDRGDAWHSRRPALRTVLVVVQTAICFVLLVAAGMFTRSLREARQMDLGFDPRGVLNVQMDTAQVGYDDERGRALFEEIERRVRRIPAVDDVSYACTVPMGYVRLSTRVGSPATTADADRVSAGMNIVGPRYFQVMRIPIVRGRSFDDRDLRSAPRAAIVNAQLARALWPGQNPIGRQFSEWPGGMPLEVVGVAATSKYRLLFEDPQPYFYVPLAQRDTALRVLHVRTSSSPPELLAGEVERVIRELEPALPLYDVQSLSDALDGGPGFFLVRTAAVFAAVLGAVAALLAIVGLYGVVSCAVTERSREMGIRLALGATRGNIARIVIADSAALAAGGAVLGAAGAVAVARVISRLLFGVAPTDPISFLAAAACLVVVTLIAASAPLTRAMATDPIASLRSE